MGNLRRRGGSEAVGGNQFTILTMLGLSLGIGRYKTSLGRGSVVVLVVVLEPRLRNPTAG